VLQNGLPRPKGRKLSGEGVFVSGGYRKRRPEDYNRSLCLDPDVLLEFVYASQPQEWEKLKAQHGADVKAKFLRNRSPYKTGAAGEGEGC
jgi:hypothetical protein